MIIPPKIGAITSDDDNQQLGSVDSCKVHSAWTDDILGEETSAAQRCIHRQENAGSWGFEES